MKTKGLTFTEAVQLLNAGKCKGIAPQVFINKNEYYVNRNDCLMHYSEITGEHREPRIMLDIFLEEWDLIEPKPKTEERVLEYWIIVWESGKLPTICDEDPLELGVETKGLAQVHRKIFYYTYTFPEEEK